MFLAADIGNTNIVIAIHDGQEWRHRFRYETKESQPQLFYETGLRDLMLEWGLPPGAIKQSGISSVVPDLTDKISAAITINTGTEPTILGPDLFVRLPIKIPKVYEIGSDLVANAYAVHHKYERNAIVIDFGTAQTFLVYKHGHGIEGVTIAPGIRTMYSTLSRATAQLPDLDLSIPASAIGTSTSTAISAGVTIGFVGMVTHIIKEMQAELTEDYTLIATGGLSTVIKPLAEAFDIVDKDLTLDGILALVNATQR